MQKQNQRGDEEQTESISCKQLLHPWVVWKTSKEEEREIFTRSISVTKYAHNVKPQIFLKPNKYG